MTKTYILSKAIGQYKNSGNYYMLNGRWHALHRKQKAPKGAAVSKNKDAAGKFSPAQHFAETEWAQLALPDTNSNAKTFNKKLNELRKYSEAGDVTAILASQYGTNTYGKKLAIIANKLLEMHGTDYKVTAGQKAGSHHVVAGESPAPVEQKAPAPSAPAAPAPAPAATPEPASNPTDYQIKHATADAGLVGTIKQGPNGKWTAGLLDTDLNKPMPDIGTFDTEKEAVAKFSSAKWVQPEHLAKPEAAKTAAPAKDIATPAFIEGKTTKGVVDYYEKQAQKIKDLAAAGDTDALAEMKANGLKPNSKGKIGNTWKGTTANSKMLIAMHDEAMGKKAKTAEPKAEKPKAKPVILSSTKPSAAPKPKAELVDTIDLSSAKTGAMAPTLTKKVFNGDNGVWFSQDQGSSILMSASITVGDSKPSEYAKNKAAEYKAAKAAGYKYTNYKVSGYQSAWVFQKDGKILTESGMANLMASTTAPAVEKPAKAPVVEAKPAAKPAQPAKKPAPSAPSADSIDWDAQLLPKENSNAKSHNKKVGEIKDMFDSLDLEALEAFKAGKNTYGKKQMKLAADAASILQGADKAGKQAEASAPSAASADQMAGMPKPPKTGDIDTDWVAKDWYKKVENGDISGLIASVGTLAENVKNDPSMLQKKPELHDLIAYGKELSLAAYQSDIPQAKTAGKPASAPVEKGPVDGETKAGADGTLVFKNGRWHKQEVAEPVTPTDSQAGQWYGDVLEVKQAIKDNNVQAITNIYDVNNGYSSPGAIVTAAYAKKALDYLASKPAVAGEPKAEKPKADQAPAPAPAPAQTVKTASGDYSVGQEIKGSKLFDLPAGSVIQINYEGKPDRKAKILANGIVFEKKTGAGGWQKNNIQPQHLKGMLAGTYGEYIIVSFPEGAAADEPATKPKRVMLSVPTGGAPAKPKDIAPNWDATINKIEEWANEGDIEALTAQVDTSALFSSEDGKKVYQYSLESLAYVKNKAKPKVNGAKPKKPDVDGAWAGMANGVENHIKDNDTDALEYMLEMLKGSNTDGGKVIANYAKEALAYLASKKEPAKTQRALEKPTPPTDDQVGGWKGDVEGVTAAVEANDIDEVKSLISLNNSYSNDHSEAFLKYANDALKYLESKNGIVAKDGDVPAKPSFALSSWNTKADLLFDAAKDGDIELIKQEVKKLQGMESEQGLKIKKYAEDCLDYAQGNQKTATKAPKKPFSSEYPEAVSAIEKYIEGGKKGALYQAMTAYANKSGFGAQIVKEYAEAGLQYLNGETNSQASADDGPKDGDMKQGAEGMLVFKNGRWHKVPVAEKANPIDSVPDPDISGFKNPSVIQEGIDELKAKIKEEGHKALNGITKKFKNGKIIMSFKSGKYNLKVNTYTNSSDTSHYKLYEYFEALKKVAPKSPKVASTGSSAVADTKPKAAAKVSVIDAMDDWKQTGKQQGSNDGGKFMDHNGEEWYCKFPETESHAKAELLAAKLYALAGFSSQDAKLITRNGKIGIASKWTNISKGGPDQLVKLEGAQSGFAVDAWLGNWDVIGQGYDNLQIGADGKAHRVDAGGSLMYRAQGEMKAFGDQVLEMDSMIDKKLNPQSASVFGSMTSADVTASVAKVLAMSDYEIRTLVMVNGPGSTADLEQLANTLIARKADLALKYPKAAKQVAKSAHSWVRLNPGEEVVEAGDKLGVKWAKIKVPSGGYNPESIAPPPDFFTNGSQGPNGTWKSSVEHVNKANNKDAQVIFDTAISPVKHSDIESLTYQAIDKDTGLPSGESKPYSEHPAAEIKEYYKQITSELKAQTRSTYKTVQSGSMTATYSTAAATLSASFKPLDYEGFKYHAQKAADYLVLSPSAAAVIPSPEVGQFEEQWEDISPKLIAFKEQSNANFQSLNSSEKAAAKAYTGSSYANWNEALRTGDINSSAFKSAQAMVKGFKKAAINIPEGTILWRGIGVGADTYKSVTGAVIQDGSFQSCSFGSRPAFASHNTWLKINVADGVKAVHATSFSQHSGEREIIIQNNVRYAVISVEHHKNFIDSKGSSHGQKTIVELLALPHEE